MQFEIVNAPHHNKASVKHLGGHSCHQYRKYLPSYMQGYKSVA